MYYSEQEEACYADYYPSTRVAVSSTVSHKSNMWHYCNQQIVSWTPIPSPFMHLPHFPSTESVKKSRQLRRHHPFSSVALAARDKKIATDKGK